ncbi:MAG: hypothetical protein MK110_06745 [Fuerstiella sp.]|nr:hypothetical protein [Fuerstiella sp.]
MCAKDRVPKAFVERNCMECHDADLAEGKSRIIEVKADLTLIAGEPFSLSPRELKSFRA